MVKSLAYNTLTSYFPAYSHLLIRMITRSTNDWLTAQVENTISFARIRKHQQQKRVKTKLFLTGKISLAITKKKAKNMKSKKKEEKNFSGLNF